MKLEPVNCTLCGGTDSELVFTVPSLRLRAQNLVFNLCRCKQCGLVRLSPRPVSEVMGVLYQPQHYTAPRQDLVRRLERLILSERVSFVRNHTHGLQVLDVGCGNGGFLNAMAGAGYDVHGLEPYQAALAGLPESLRQRIRCEPLEKAGFPEASFDVITFWHILEHLDRPIEALQRIRGSLKADGTLIIEVPDFNSHEARWLGPCWYNLDAPYHFWHFTPATLKAVVQQAGFQVTTCVTSAVTRPVWLLNYLLLGASAAAEWLQARHPVWRKWPKASIAAGFLLCAVNRTFFAYSCPMLRLVCRKSS